MNTKSSEKTVRIRWGRIIFAVLFIVLLLAMPKLVTRLVRSTYTAVDPFAALDVRLEGDSGRGYLEYALTVNDPVLQECDYSVSQREGLSNGDVVTFSVQAEDDLLDKSRTRLTRTQMEYTVENLPIRLDYSAELTDGQREALAACLQDFMSGAMTNEDTRTYPSTIEKYITGDIYARGRNIQVDTLTPVCVFLAKTSDDNRVAYRVTGTCTVPSGQEDVAPTVTPFDVYLGTHLGTVKFSGEELEEFSMRYTDGFIENPQVFASLEEARVSMSYELGLYNELQF